VFTNVCKLTLVLFSIGTVYALSQHEQQLVAASGGQHVWVFDVRNLSEPLQQRQSSLKFQIRCAATHPSGEYYAMGSIEGRVAVDYIDPARNEQGKFAFKCHRDKVRHNSCDALQPFVKLECLTFVSDTSFLCRTMRVSTP